MKHLKLIAVAVLSFALLAGCSAGGAKEGAAADRPGSARDGNEVTIESASMKLVKAVEEGQYELISTEDLKGKIDAKEDMVIVDTMPEKSFKKNRIPGAVNAELPVKMEEVTPEQKEAFIQALGTDKAKTIVLYCGFVDCERSHVGAMIAKEEGFTNVLRQPGGIGAWLDAEYPVESD
ncbi:PQQ-dependent catabolism-associated CXXCW motif protein [Aedoeadaptatus ivorii]|uniref:PQQ-dependent catabolism-associated CXXCW motif protein n=1 Tax=Aedoeadaptatus ivorii TaxID=54006 RepID=A0A3S5C2R8_9FIRM|nr:rhodanese-like domain-containing protein [Peptoniphilus ivorii]MDQ0508808.1 rhodanese-related sulfurtransferase [Peptoniphilus ivorii]VEJ36072.1 PQQ-dependent catabolism-associated CXXCW motif protein [Peptoniphilus ivorii]